VGRQFLQGVLMTKNSFQLKEIGNENHIHVLKGDKDRNVWLNGKQLLPDESQFNWGYGGIGPTQLALAIMLELTGRDEGYQNFKWKYIAPLCIDEPFKIMFTDADIAKVISGE